MEKKFFICNGKVRWIKCFITKDVELDDGTIHLVVSMNNCYNRPCSSKDCIVENVCMKDCFETEKDAQFEIMRRERFKK